MCSEKVHFYLWPWTLQELYSSRVSKRAGKITLDPHIQHTPSVNGYRLVDATELWAPERPDTDTAHPAHSLCERLPSGRRDRALSTRTTRHRHSTSSTLSLWTVTVWSTLQSSEHQNDQTQTQHIQHTLSVNGYRLVDATELWAPERPDTDTAHPAHSLCERLPSGRRDRALSTRTTRHRHSTSSTLSLWTVTVWSTRQSSEHQNDQTQTQHIQHTLSVNGYRLVDATEPWAPERPDTDTAHPAHSLCERLPSGRRDRALSTRTTRHRHSTFSTLSLWTVTVWSTLQSSEHQNDQTQTQHIQHTPSVNGYRLVDATELWAPERPDTDTAHPAHSLCERLPSGRRYRALSTRTTRHRHSTSSTLSLWTVTIWSTRQSSEHQNDQTQNQCLPSGNPSHEHLTLNVEHTTLLYIIYSSHLLIFHFKFAHSRPVHT